MGHGQMHATGERRGRLGAQVVPALQASPMAQGSEAVIVS